MEDERKISPVPKTPAPIEEPQFVVFARQDIAKFFTYAEAEKVAAETAHKHKMPMLIFQVVGGFEVETRVNKIPPGKTVG